MRIVKSFIETGLPLNVVNVRGTPTTTHGMVVRHYNRVGVLAMVLDALKAEGVNVEEMQNSIFEGGTAATCSLRLDKIPQPTVVAELMTSSDVIQVSTH